jgi:flagellar protein FliL
VVRLLLLRRRTQPHTHPIMSAPDEEGGSDEHEAASAVAPAAATPAKRMGPMLLMIAGLAGGGLGGVAGAFLVAPRLAGGASAPAATTTSATASPSEAGDAEGAKGDKKNAKGPVPGRIYRIDNVIVNPAGSDGTRFLMASVAYEIQTEAAEQTLHAHEVQMRDDVIGVLETMTMDRLLAPHARDSIKVQLLELARKVLGPQVPVDVYLPQFVIQ